MVKYSKLKKGTPVVIGRWEKMPIFPFRMIRFKGKILSGPDECDIYQVKYTHYQNQGHKAWIESGRKYCSSHYRSELRSAPIRK